MATQTSISYIVKRYATALIELSNSEKDLDKIYKDMATLLDLIAGSEDLRNVLKDPLINRTEQTAAILAIAKKAKTSKIVQNFVGVLGENRRLSILEHVARAVQKEIAKRRGNVSVEITSATTLDEKQIKKLTTALKKIATGDVDLELKEDPSIIGGLIVKIGSTMVDNSVKTKLSRLHREMKKQNVSVAEPKMKEVA